MHEIRRQEYLQAIGIENYIPRWKIPFAAESYFCDSSIELGDQANDDITLVESIVVDTTNSQQDQLQPTIDLHQVLNGVVEKSLVKNSPSRIDDILQQLVDKKSPQIPSFSLSVWRPEPDFLVVATRNVNAMPTELLLNNFLRFYLKQNQLALMEDMLHWPAIDSSKMSLTEEDACTELQTWLSVQHEFQPIKTLWFFGDVCRYFTADFAAADTEFFVRDFPLKLGYAHSNQVVMAKHFPDLSDILLHPSLKAKLLSLI